MPIIETVKGNILDAKEDVIVQQCNCVTITACGLSKVIKQKWKWADPYGSRRREGRKNCAISDDRDIPGTIRVLETKETKTPKVVCLFSQWSPGKSNIRYEKTYPDGKYDRLRYFEECLWKLDEYCKENRIKTVAVPYGIGCGLAGGNWNDYVKELEKTKVDVVLYKLE